MSDEFQKLERGEAKTLSEFFAPIGEALLSEAEREKKRNQALSGAVQGDETTEGAAEAKPAHAEKLEKVRRLREEGDHVAAGALDGAITHAERFESFADMVESGWAEAKAKPRHPLTGGLLDGPGT